MKKRIWPLIMQCISLLLLVVVIVCIYITRSRSLDSIPLIETLGSVVGFISFSSCLPFGIIGKIVSKNDNLKFPRATKILSIVNICIGGLMICSLSAFLIVVICCGWYA